MFLQRNSLFMNTNKKLINEDDYKEEQILKMFDGITIGYALCEMVYDQDLTPIDYRFLRINKGFQEQTGLEITTTIGRTIKEIFPDIELIWIERFALLASNQVPIHFTEYNHNTNKFYDIYGFSQVKGKFSILISDITEQKKTEIKFLDSQSLLSVIFNNTRDLQLLVEYQGNHSFKVVAVNNSYLDKGKQFGIHVTKEDLIGKTLEVVCKDYIYLEPDVVKNTINNYKKVIDSNQQIKFVESVSIENFPYHAEVTLTPIINSENGKKYVFYNSHDITKETESIRLLKDSEERFALAVKASNAGIWDWKVLESDKLWVSDRLYEILGYQPGEVEARFSNWKDWIHPNDSKRVMKVLKNHLENNVSYQLEFRIRKKTGDYAWIFTRGASVLNEHGKPIRIAGSVSDRTERKKVQISLKLKSREIEAKNQKLYQANQELLKTKERAEESDRLKSAFLANMSHEIRTPMNGILGFSRLLKDPGLSGDEQNNYIKIIERAGDRMLNIINDIISISKIESGERNISYTDTDIYNQVDFVCNLLKPEAENKNIGLYIDKQFSKKNIVIRTDGEKLFAILTNLVKNAIKYTQQGEITIGYSQKEEFLEFFVKDTGIGIAEDRQDVIFERFIQADIQNVMAKQGAGLGLSISKAFLDMLGGKIWLESKEGIGSTFYFAIPYQPGTEELEVKEKTIAPVDEEFEINKIKTLIAEDDKISAMLISKEMDKYSKKVIKAQNGLEAVEMFQENPDTDLILMDIQMPVMNGYIATQEIRKINKDVIIIAQSAFALSGDKDKALVAGCNDYLTKPINRIELLTLLQKYFKK